MRPSGWRSLTSPLSPGTRLFVRENPGIPGAARTRTLLAASLAPGAPTHKSPGEIDLGTRRCGSVRDGLLQRWGPLRAHTETWWVSRPLGRSATAVPCALAKLSCSPCTGWEVISWIPVDTPVQGEAWLSPPSGVRRQERGPVSQASWEPGSVLGVGPTCLLRAGTTAGRALLTRLTEEWPVRGGAEVNPGLMFCALKCMACRVSAVLRLLLPRA